MLIWTRIIYASLPYISPITTAAIIDTERDTSELSILSQAVQRDEEAEIYSKLNLALLYLEDREPLETVSKIRNCSHDRLLKHLPVLPHGLPCIAIFDIQRTSNISDLRMSSYHRLQRALLG